MFRFCLHLAPDVPATRTRWAAYNIDYDRTTTLDYIQHILLIHTITSALKVKHLTSKKEYEEQKVSRTGLGPGR